MRLSGVKSGESRHYLFFITCLVFGGLLFARLAELQILDPNNYKERALAYQQTASDIAAVRGEIFVQDKDKRLTAVATNKKWQRAYLIPNKFTSEEVKTLGPVISEIVRLDPEVVMSRLGKMGDPYEPLKSQLSETEYEALLSLHHSGIGLEEYADRYYPFDELAAQTIGFLGHGNKGRRGQYGVEGSYDDELSGDSGAAVQEVDGRGQFIPFGTKSHEPAQDGAEIVLTIDQNVTKAAQDEVAALLKEYKAKTASILVLDPRNGAIRAMASAPTFNPNHYNAVASVEAFNNPVIQAPYEPGSIFKPITMAAALDAGRVQRSTTYNDTGLLHFGTYTIQNFDKQAYGIVDMTTVLEKSLNTGAVFAQQRLGNDEFRNYLEAFGFGENTGLGLIGEASGDIRNLSSKRDVNFATAAFGQGITTTMLQLGRAFAALANGGDLISPYLVERVLGADGTIKIHEASVRRKVISEATSKTISAMLTSVVDQGFDRRAAVAGYNLAGKTGTAQIANPQGGYLEDSFTHSFAGYGPTEAPRFVIIIRLDQPIGVNFASRSVAPVFARLAKYILNYYAIPPIQTER